METITEKACSRCGEIKVASEFRSEPRNRSGLSSACAECQRKQQKNRYSRDKDRIRQAARDAANQRVPDIPESKLCPKCGLIKPSDLFYKDKYQADGLQNACKDCRRPYHQTEKRKEYDRVYAATRGKEIGKLYREENADYIKASKKQYRLDNLDAVKARDLRYRDEHRDEINEKERNKRRENRRQAVAILGNHCVLCNPENPDAWEYEFLTVDHVYGDGAEERRRLSHYRILKNIVDGVADLSRYRILCWNHNDALGLARKDGDVSLPAQKARRWRDEVIAAYGGKCACCGQSTREFLHLDHVNGGGCAERKERGGLAAYLDAKRLGFPADYQVLCANCNHSKYRGDGLCVHQREFTRSPSEILLPSQELQTSCHL